MSIRRSSLPGRLVRRSASQRRGRTGSWSIFTRTSRVCPELPALRTGDRAGRHHPRPLPPLELRPGDRRLPLRHGSPIPSCTRSRRLPARHGERPGWHARDLRAVVRRPRPRDLLPAGHLDYFHTHICAPNAPNCGTLPGVRRARITGSSPAPGKLTIGVLVPVPGTWRLFLQMKLGGRIVTAPYTLKVAS